MAHGKEEIQLSESTLHPAAGTCLNIGTELVCEVMNAEEGLSPSKDGCDLCSVTWSDGCSTCQQDAKLRVKGYTHKYLWSGVRS